MNRRTFCGSLGAGLGSLGAAAPAPSRRPNIVLIMADDLGFSDIGCYGSEISTPNLDRLAAQGIRFTHFTNAARCCPTRAALLTGLYPHQAGVGMMVGNLGKPSYQGYLNDSSVTIAEALRPAGYRTIMAGKWHVGENRPHWPTDRGFERYFGLISGASNYFRLEEGRKMALNDQPYTPSGDFYMTDAFATHALGFLDELAGKGDPFFLYLPFTSPHWPLHARPEDIARYRGKFMAGWDELRRRRHKRQIEMGIVNPKWPLTPRDEAVPAWADVKNKEEWDLRMAVYAAQIDRMDQNIGRLLAKLKALGEEDNTLVMFLADNGGCHEDVERGQPGAPAGTPDSFTSYKRHWANLSNTPFRMYKHWVHEGGVASPLIARWPGRIPKGGAVTHQFGNIIDLMATCVDAAGARYPAGYRGKPITPLEGRSLVPVFEGKTRTPHPAVFWEHAGNRAVRQGNWKLVSRYREPWELYDLEADRTEMNNLASAQPERAGAMAKLYDAWAARNGVFTPDQLRAAGKKKS